MSMVVQHNLQAMNSNRMLGVTTSAQSKSTEKLSSGYRINRAADDAAGLTISEKMRKQMRGLDRASTNAQDGVSAVQTAEGALTEVHSMLQRMNELAVQAANGTNSEADREAIQAEIDQLSTEIDRVAETTKFNEIYLLKGDEGTKTINMEAHDAGLKGKLVDNGDGTATFTMDALKAGDTVTIAGKTYKIAGGAEEEEEENQTAAGQADAQAAVDALLAAGVNGDTITVGGTTYAHNGTQWEDNANAGTAVTEITVAAGDQVTINDTTAGTNTAYYTGADVADAQTAVDALLAAGTNGDTITVGTTTYAHNGTQWEDAANAGTAVTAITIAAGDEVTIDDTTNSVKSIYYTEPEAEEEGEETPATTTKEISVDEAYKLAREALVAANQIGDSKGTAAVKFGTAAGEEGSEATADDFHVGDKKTIGGTEYTVGDTEANVKTIITDAITQAVADDTSSPANTNGAAATLLGNVSDGTNTIYILKAYDGSVVYNSTNSASNPAANTPPTGDKTATDIDALIAAGATVTFTADTNNGLTAAHNASGSVADDADGSTLISAQKMADLVNNPPADGDADAGTPSNVFMITAGSADVANTLSFNLHVGSDADMNNKITVDIDTMNSAFLGVRGLNVTDKDGMAATYAIDAIADAISKVSEQRSALGAIQNRLEHTIANLDNVVENTTAAESRIRDTDMAEEMVEYSKNNILAQAGQSMLAQANQSTQGVLSLLG